MLQSILIYQSTTAKVFLLKHAGTTYKQACLCLAFSISGFLTSIPFTTMSHDKVQTPTVKYLISAHLECWNVARFTQKPALQKKLLQTSNSLGCSSADFDHQRLKAFLALDGANLARPSQSKPETKGWHPSHLVLSLLPSPFQKHQKRLLRAFHALEPKEFFVFLWRLVLAQFFSIRFNLSPFSSPTGEPRQ